MKIVNVKDKQYYRYIPLKGWESVENAISTYAAGFTKGSTATRDEQVRAITEDSGGFAAMFYVASSDRVGNRSQLVEKMLSDAKSALSSRDRWSKHYDYDGMGTSFFKTSVDISIIDRDLDLYALSIHAAYVGDEPEKDLAEYLGISRALIWSSVNVETLPVNGDCFEFDFEEIIRKLKPILRMEGVDGETVAQKMMTVDDFGESKPGFVLDKEGEFVISINPLDVKRRFDWEDPFGPDRRQVDTWSIDGAILSGLLATSYCGDEDKKQSPKLAVHIQKGDEKIWKMEEQDKVILITDAIAKALK